MEKSGKFCICVLAALVLFTLLIAESAHKRQRFSEKVDEVLGDFDAQIMLLLINSAESHLPVHLHQRFVTRLKQGVSDEEIRAMIGDLHVLFGQALVEEAGKAGAGDSPAFKEAYAKLTKPYENLFEMIRIRQRMLELKNIYPEDPYGNLSALTEEMHAVYRKEGIKFD